MILIILNGSVPARTLPNDLLMTWNITPNKAFGLAHRGQPERAGFKSPENLRKIVLDGTLKIEIKWKRQAHNMIICSIETVDFHKNFQRILRV